MFFGGASDRIFGGQLSLGAERPHTRWVSSSLSLFSWRSESEKKIGRYVFLNADESEMQPGFTWTFESDKPSPPCYLLSPVGTFVACFHLQPGSRSWIMMSARRSRRGLRAESCHRHQLLQTISHLCNGFLSLYLAAAQANTFVRAQDQVSLLCGSVSVCCSAKCTEKWLTYICAKTQLHTYFLYLKAWRIFCLLSLDWATCLLMILTSYKINLFYGSFVHFITFGVYLWNGQFR